MPGVLARYRESGGASKGVGDRHHPRAPEHKGGEGIARGVSEDERGIGGNERGHDVLDGDHERQKAPRRSTVERPDHELNQIVIGAPGAVAADLGVVEADQFRSPVECLLVN